MRRVSAEAKLRFRQTPRAADVPAVRALARKTGVFSRDECAVAGELVGERLRLGVRSSYRFSFAEAASGLVGYAAWGQIPMTERSFDLYWVIVDPAYQGQGLGRWLLSRAEDAVRTRADARLYIETSSRDQYARTRRFYKRAGYTRVARLDSYYAPGDDKLIFCKILMNKQ